MSRLSSADSICENAAVNPDGFSAVKALGSFINNRDFSRGFADFLQNRPSAQAYVWNCLSACADQIGETVYANVRNYVDFVSNVETCKIQALRSMMKEYGFDYTVFDDIELVPAEVLDLMHIMSIDRKYLLNSKYLKDNLRKDLAERGVISEASVELSDYYAVSSMTEREKASLVSSYETLDESKYFDYTCGLFETLLSGFCSLKYLQEPDDEKNKYYIYKTLNTDQYGDTVDQSDIDFSEYKRQHNIPVSFSPSKVVDAIDEGEDSLDNYQYPYYDLLMKEIDRRASKVSLSELNTADPKASPVTDKERSIRNETRYSYYRKAKVRQYVSFVDNKYFIETAGGDTHKLYDIDQRYVCYDDAKSSVLSCDDSTGAIVGLNGDVIKTVAKSLAVTTRYVNKLREKLKLQTRKNYMKGTQNLLLYIINEYFIDYSRHQAETIDLEKYPDEQDRADISAVLSALGSHSIDDLNVIEYYDDTEYYNLSTSTSGKAVNADSVNQRFWAEANMCQDDGKTLALAEIQRFYLSSLAMQDALSSPEMLSDFLETVFDVGADRSYVDLSTGMFTAKLSAYGRYSDDVYREYCSLSDAYYSYIPYKPDGYEYIEGAISDQVSSAVSAISVDLREKYSEGISSVYDQYVVSVDSFDDRFEEMNDTFDQIVSGDNSLYFISSDCKYCFKTDSVTGEKKYRHDYYVGNPEYQDDDNYFTTKLNTFRIYVDGSDSEGSPNVTNFPVVDTVSAVYDSCKAICADWQGSIVPELVKYGFTDLCASTLDQEFKDGYDFVTDKRDRRLTFLQNQLDQVRSDASQLKTLFQNVQTNFAAVVAGYDDGFEGIDITVSAVYAVSRKSLSWKIQYADNMRDDIGCTGFCRVGNNGTVKNLEWIQYNVSLNQYAYRLTSDYQEVEEIEYETGTNGYIRTDLSGYNESDPLETRIDAFIAYLNAPTAFDYTTHVEGEGSEAVTVYESYDTQKYYGLKKEGSYAAAVQCQENIETIKETIRSVVNQINAIGGDLDYDQLMRNDIGSAINKIIEYITTEFSEANFENDAMIKAYKELLKEISALSSTYVPYKEDYLALYTTENQTAYLAEFSHSNDLTFEILSKLLTYAKNKDKSGKEDIVQQYDDLREQLSELEQDYETLASQMQQLEYEYYRPGVQYEPYYDQYSGIIEIGLADSRAFLVKDLASKQDDVDWKVSYELEKVDGYVATMTSEISASLDSTDGFEDTVLARLEELDIFKDKQYSEKKGMFLTYAGQEMCYYPYFNLKNVTHPTYQIHPFLWNFVSRSDASIGSLTKVFYSINPSDLDGTKFAKNVDRYYGKFGQSVNKWMNPDLVDYSGYTTRYESSDHVSDKTQVSSEVVDFDGLFYPPAVSALFRSLSLNGSIQKCVNSISCGVYFSGSKNRNGMVKALPGAISSYVKVVENYDEEKGQISSWTYDGDVSVYGLLSGIVEPYLVSVDLSGGIDSYFRKNLTEAHVSSVTSQKLVDSLISGFEPTYYDRFYKHLNYQQNQAEREYLAKQLSSNFDSMRKTVFSAQPKADQYDVYRYGVDQNGNMYSLLKQYHDEEPSYLDRRNARGSLWIRFKDHPLAFPAFTGKYPNSCTSSYYGMPQPVRRLAGYLNDDVSAYYNDSVKHLSSVMSCFYDFELTKNGQYLYLVSDRRETGVSEDERLKIYENPWLINCPTTYANNDVVLMDFVHSAASADATTTIIRSGAYDQEESKLSAVPLSGHPVESYAYLGAYLKSNTTTDFVYAKKSYDIDSDGQLCARPTGEVKVLRTVNGLHKSGSDIKGTGLTPSPAASDVCFAYDADGILTIAYVKEKDLDRVKTSLSSATDLDENTDGPIFSDPRSGEMNSHDVFTSDIAVVKCSQQVSRLVKASRKNAVDSIFNTNADMSYLPCYPGVSGEISVYATQLSSADMLPFELLGDSKNIDENIKIVNEYVDPYFDMGRISADYVFGRVYEDWIDYQGKDNTLRLFGNDTINSRNDPQHMPSAFVWTIPLSAYEYHDNAKKTLRAIVYNSDTLGKNPYFVGRVNALSTESGEWLDIGNYNDEFSVANSREVSVGTTVTGANLGVNATGTFNGRQYMNRSDCNHLDNIESVKIRYVPDSQELQFRFDIEDQSLSSETFIRKNLVRVVLYNPNDLTMFKYFHYLDAYGAVNVFDGKIDVPSDVAFKNGAVRFVYDRKKYEELNLSAKMQSYYEEGGVKRFLTGSGAIQLSDYTCLSDVYILRGTRGLSLKYSAEEYFDFGDDHYYFPTLNVKYPKTPGDFVSSPSCMFENQARENQLSGIFGEGNLYILDLADPSQISGRLGRVEIPVSYDDADCFRCFEFATEFEETPAETGTLTYFSNQNSINDVNSRFTGYAVQDYFTGGSCVSSLYGKYDVEDSRTMQYVRFNELYTDYDDVEAAPEESVILSAISVAFEQHYETNAFLDAVSAYTMPRFSESVENTTLESIKFDVKSADFSGLMKMYVNYKKSDGGIVLYFNYFNYLNTPYVRIDGNKVYPAYVDGTYLKLEPGESGTVDIVVQFKYYVGTTVYGCKNAKLASYRVSNVSDDKPKFLINEIDRIKPGDLLNASESPNVNVRIAEKTIKVSGYQPSEYPKSSIECVIESDQKLVSPFSIGIDYPYDLVTANIEDVSYGIAVKEDSSGYLTVTVLDQAVDYFKIGVTSKYTEEELAGYANKYKVEVDSAYIVGQNGYAASVETENGAFVVTKQ